MYACRRCEERIPGDADVCPECEYDPSGTVRDVAAVLLAFAVVLVIAVPPVGVFVGFLGVLLFGWSFLRTPAVRLA